jgi:hypothetical protein
MEASLVNYRDKSHAGDPCGDIRIGSSEIELYGVWRSGT